MRSKLMMLLVLAAISTVGTQVLGQIDDPIAKAKTFPPSELTSAENAANLRAIDWQLERKVFLIDQYRESMNHINAGIEKQSAVAERLAGEIPSEVRFVDADVRSRLVGKLMEDLLDARLNLATQEATLAALQEMFVDKQKNSQANSVKSELEIDVMAAQKKVEVARFASDKAAALGAKGLTSQSDKMMALYTADIAVLELEKAKGKLMRADSPDSELAKRLSNSRIEIEPVKARIAAAEKYLKTFSESAQIHREIEKAQQAIGYWEKDKQFIARELASISREVEELKVLRSLVKKAIEKGAGKDDK